jgi:hypothetical protein
MDTSIRTQLLVFALAECAVAALAAPAFGNGGGGITLHRDGSKAVPFVAHVGGRENGSSGVPVLHRDGSKVVPFADLQSKAHAATGEFDWAHAGIGAAFALALVGAGTLVVASRRHRAKRAVTTA